MTGGWKGDIHKHTLCSSVEKIPLWVESVTTSRSPALKRRRETPGRTAKEDCRVAEGNDRYGVVLEFK